MPVHPPRAPVLLAWDMPGTELPKKKRGSVYACEPLMHTLCVTVFVSQERPAERAGGHECRQQTCAQLVGTHTSDTPLLQPPLRP